MGIAAVRKGTGCRIGLRRSGRNERRPKQAVAPPGRRCLKILCVIDYVVTRRFTTVCILSSGHSEGAGIIFICRLVIWLLICCSARADLQDVLGVIRGVIHTIRGLRPSRRRSRARCERTQKSTGEGFSWRASRCPPRSAIRCARPSSRRRSRMALSWRTCRRRPGIQTHQRRSLYDQRGHKSEKAASFFATY